METVRPALRNAILRELDNTPFGKDLFDVKLQQEDFLIKITYIPNLRFTFVIKKLAEPVAPRYYFATYEAPGQWMLETEEIMHENFAQARARIHSWARRIEEDYKAAEPEFEALEELRATIFKNFRESDNLEGERFTSSEKEKFDAKLDELQSKLEDLLKDKHAKQDQIDMMKEQIRKLKNGIEILDKRTWSLAAVNRVLNIFKEVRAAVGEVKTLTRDFENLLPDLSAKEGNSHNREGDEKA
jgi:hypothetical protein